MTGSTFGNSSQRGLMLGVLLSLCAHVATLVVFALPSDASGDRAETPHRAIDSDQTPQIRLGVQKSNAVTVNWVGFETPTEHVAEQSTVEQAALSPEIGQEATAAATPMTTPEVAEPAEAQQPIEAAVASPPQPSTEQAVAETVASLVPMVSTMDDAPSQEVVEEVPVVVAQPAPESVEQPEVKPTAEATPAPSQASAQGSPGEEDRRESDASSLSKSLEYRPGRPLATEGLEITTVRPRYSVTTRSIARPRDPHITIEFDAKGVVKRAYFAKIEGRVRSTGHEHVDGPLLDAIYRWKAEGLAIKDLKGDQTVAITIRVILGAER